MNVSLAIVSFVLGCLLAIPVSLWIIDAYDSLLSINMTNRQLDRINSNIKNLQNTKPVTSAYNNSWSPKKDVVPPSALYFGKIGGEEEHIAGDLEEKYLSFLDLQDYRNQLRAASLKDAEQNRIVTSVEEEIASKKAKTFH